MKKALALFSYCQNLDTFLCTEDLLVRWMKQHGLKLYCAKSHFSTREHNFPSSLCQLLYTGCSVWGGFLLLELFVYFIPIKLKTANDTKGSNLLIYLVGCDNLTPTTQCGNEMLLLWLDGIFMVSFRSQKWSSLQGV